MKKTLANLSEKLNIITLDSAAFMDNSEELCNSKIEILELQDKIPHSNLSFTCVLCEGYNYNCPGYNKF